MSMEEALKDHAKIAVDEIKDTLKDKWDALTDDQQHSLQRAAERMVKLEWKKRVEGKDVDGDIAFVKTTLNGFKLAGEIAAYDAFWKGVNKALEALGSFLIGAGKSLVPGLGTLFNGINLKDLIDG